MFKIGEFVIYKRDLCKIKSIEKNLTNNLEYYCLSPIEDDSLSIKVPTTNKFNYLRYPISKKQAEELINSIPSILPLNTNDKLLEAEYKALMKTNHHEDLIKIIKTTYLRNEFRKNNGKKIGDKDLTYFNQAERFLYNELSFSLGKGYDECKNYIIEKVCYNLKKDNSSND